MRGQIHMSHIPRLASAVLITFLLSNNSVAQTKLPTGPTPTEQVDEMRDINSRSAALNSMEPPPTRRRKMSHEEKKLLRSPVILEGAYADFLREPRSGIVRLLPRERYEGKITLRGGGAYYSFDRHDQEYGYGSDIGLENGQFVVGLAGADYGFLVQLGPLPLDDVTTNTPALQFLTSVRAPLVESQAREDYRRSRRGLPLGQFLYASRVTALNNMTYGLRSIIYGKSDLLVVFRVVEKESDSSMVLLWRILKKYPVPQLKSKE